MRWFLRIFILLLALALLAGGGVLAWFRSARIDKLASLNAGSSFEPGAGLSGVEYAQAGEGPAVVVFHGSPGGYDQALALSGALIDEGFQIIAPSRPGYLRTPLATGLTPEDQADAVAKLLDKLNIGSVAVAGFSYGAPAAVAFAKRFPSRTWALVLVSPLLKKVTLKEFEIAPPTELNRRLTGDVGAWLVARTAENDSAKALGWAFDLTCKGGPTERESWIRAVAQDPQQAGSFAALVGTLFPISPREDGLRNDIIQATTLPDLGLPALTVPTLVLQGSFDSVVPPAVATDLPQSAEIITVPDAGHLVYLGAQSGGLRGKVSDFLRRFSGGHGAP